MSDEKIVEKLDHIGGTLDEILALLKKPENKILRAVNIIGAGVAALSFLSIVDVTRNWIVGG
ncbi:hypothetical protein FACS1894190_04860 [Spirochaetia bacterium]|nr:hypothetical protein FACS1894190_04860 [Spirochaetia bacterium]